MDQKLVLYSEQDIQKNKTKTKNSDMKKTQGNKGGVFKDDYTTNYANVARKILDTIQWK